MNNAGVVSAGHGIKAPGSSQRPSRLVLQPGLGQGGNGVRPRGRERTKSVPFSPSPQQTCGQQDKYLIFKYKNEGVQEELWKTNRSPGPETFYSGQKSQKWEDCVLPEVSKITGN